MEFLARLGSPRTSVEGTTTVGEGDREAGAAFELVQLDDGSIFAGLRFPSLSPEQVPKFTGIASGDWTLVEVGGADTILRSIHASVLIQTDMLLQGESNMFVGSQLHANSTTWDRVAATVRTTPLACSHVTAPGGGGAGCGFRGRWKRGGRVTPPA